MVYLRCLGTLPPPTRYLVGALEARRDLGVEVPIVQIPVIQKRLMSLARMHAKPVITATQMLESMTDNRRPNAC